MPSNISSLSLVLMPLGAGDLIDRAIRLYRNNFWTFVWIAAPPVLIGTLITIGWTMLGRELFSIGSDPHEDFFLFYIFTGCGNIG